MDRRYDGPFVDSRAKVIVSTALFVLLLIGLSCCNYSGQGMPPKFGDYEAQRHWMEVTINLPLQEWYISSPSNNLTYWGLDYPPLTAYHSYAMGFIGNLINTKWFALLSSHGIEDPNLKVFMRFTVFLAMLFYLKGAYNFLGQTKLVDMKTFLICVMSPGLLLIDCGHFHLSCGTQIASYSTEATTKLSQPRIKNYGKVSSYGAFLKENVTKGSMGGDVRKTVQELGHKYNALTPQQKADFKVKAEKWSEARAEAFHALPSEEQARLIESQKQHRAALREKRLKAESREEHKEMIKVIGKKPMTSFQIFFTEYVQKHKMENLPMSEQMKAAGMEFGKLEDSVKDELRNRNKDVLSKWIKAKKEYLAKLNNVQQ
uniref:Alpha-1,3-glucosyltransferase n=1 Tax=Rhabditophanes sp. KR3021 TaxID=114890 RepID=A0AC35UGC4_9BILA